MFVMRSILSERFVNRTTFLSLLYSLFIISLETSRPYCFTLLHFFEVFFNQTKPVNALKTHGNKKKKKRSKDAFLKLKRVNPSNATKNAPDAFCGIVPPTGFRRLYFPPGNRPLVENTRSILWNNVVRQRKTTTLMYKTIICFFSFSFII